MHAAKPRALNTRHLEALRAFCKELVRKLCRRPRSHYGDFQLRAEELLMRTAGQGQEHHEDREDVAMRVVQRELKMWMQDAEIDGSDMRLIVLEALAWRHCTELAS